MAHAEQGTKSPRVTETALCGSIATTIKVSGEDSGAEVEYELDQNVNGRSWSLTLKRNGSDAPLRHAHDQDPQRLAALAGRDLRAIRRDVLGVGHEGCQDLHDQGDPLTHRY